MYMYICNILVKVYIVHRKFTWPDLSVLLVILFIVHVKVKYRYCINVAYRLIELCENISIPLSSVPFPQGKKQEGRSRAEQERPKRPGPNCAHALLRRGEEQDTIYLTEAPCAFVSPS